MKFRKIYSKIFNYFRLINKFKHIYYVRQANKVLKKISEINKTEYGLPKSINYLKKINPYVFEELILSVVENNNISIKRNLKYSGDGGFDGYFKYLGYEFYIQCKRYNDYIALEHVKKFSRQIDNLNYENNKSNIIGLFFHTGKTGKNSKNEFSNNNKIVFISGEKLINLLLNNITLTEAITNKRKANQKHQYQ